jgi:hypothetical protein
MTYTPTCHLLGDGPGFFYAQDQIFADLVVDGIHYPLPGIAVSIDGDVPEGRSLS